MTVTELSAQRAVNEKGEDVSNLLAAADNNYYVTVSGQRAELTFKEVPRAEDLARSYVLKTRGFYYQWIDTHGPEQADLLKRVLTEPGFAAKKYLPEWKKEKEKFGEVSN